MTIYYVNASASQLSTTNGLSWEAAYADLQDALNVAGNDDEIWVAAGTYKPGDNRADTFTIDANVTLYGGFAGGETSLAERDYETNQTILSGDIGTENDNSDNSQHVVTVSSTATLDGVIIQDGNTEGAANTDGGGISNSGDGTLTLKNVIVQNNESADDGGGIGNNATLIIYNSTIRNNIALATSNRSGGGGLFNTDKGTVTLISSTVSDNTSAKQGGGIRNDGTLTVVSSTISGNTAEESGGGFFNTISALFEEATATITSSTITNNTANNKAAAEQGAIGGGGGGIANLGILTLGNTILSGNTDATDRADDLQDTFDFGFLVSDQLESQLNRPEVPVGNVSTLDSTAVADAIGLPFSASLMITTVITSNGNNLVGDISPLTTADFNASQGDQTGVTNPELGSLMNNGGFTETHKPGSTSPVLDAGNGDLSTGLSETVLKFDITGDGNATDTDVIVNELAAVAGVVIGTAVDIGAYELQECFLAGTLILTENGEKAVEELAIGDRLQTLSGHLEPIQWIGRQTYDRATAHPLRSNPIQIKPGALGNNLPRRDLFVSPDHALLVDRLLINAGALTNGTSIVQIQPQTDTFTYYHVELQHHALLLAEGTAAESYLPQKQDRSTFDNGDEYAALYPAPTLISLLPMNYPRVSSKRQLPRFVSKRLETVGRSLYGDRSMAIQPINTPHNLNATGFGN